MESATLLSRLENKFARKTMTYIREKKSRQVRQSLTRLKGLAADQMSDELELGTLIY